MLLFVDQNPQIVAYLKDQLTLLQVNSANVYRAKVPATLPFLTSLTAKFDIIFLDPPFHQNLIAPCCQWLEEQDCLAESAIIYIEAEATLDPLPIPSHWEVFRNKTSGQVGYYLIKRL